MMRVLLTLCLLLLPLVVGLGPVATKWNTTKCPEKCTCLQPYTQHSQTSNSLKERGLGLRTVDCSKRKLTVIPTTLPEDTESLLLGGNAIHDITFPLPYGLQHLDLSYNSLGDLPALGMNLTQLEYLYLQGNRLTELPSSTLNGMRKLKILALDKNYITKIESNAFMGLNDLRQLSITDNKLRTIEKSWFKGLSSLDTLELDGNEIKEVCTSCFKGAKGLTRLSLSHNYIEKIEKGTFSGLKKLNVLNLDNNLLEEVPTAALGNLPYLQNVSISGNGIERLQFRDFQHLDVIEIILNNIPTLYSVDKESFFSLQSLVVLEMHDNVKLTYLDEDAFVKCNSLTLLYLQNNNLLAIGSHLAASLPNLQSISLYHNPLHCDCNVFWVKEMMGAYHDYYDSFFSLTVTNESADNTSLKLPPITFQHADKFICDTPLSMNAKLLKSIPLSYIPKSCPPTVIPFFNDSHQKELGDSITYECRAIGVPRPHIHWILSNGKVVNNTSNYSRVRLDGMGTLKIEHIKAIDSGTYTCVASNTKGYDTTSTVLRVHNKGIKIMSTAVATNFVALTWSGTGSTITSSKYVITYRQRGTNDDANKIEMRPYMRSYTVTGLEPSTMYEFCLAYVHSGRTVNLNCMDVTTKRQLHVMQGAIHTAGNITVIIAVATSVSFLLVLCTILACLRKCRSHRKQYKEADGFNVPGPATSATTPSTSREQASGGGGHLSQIPLDNLYKPPSTPLCTSTTSLISSSNA